jgi:hypothetical protein
MNNLRRLTIERRQQGTGRLTCLPPDPNLGERPPADWGLTPQKNFVQHGFTVHKCLTSVPNIEKMLKQRYIQLE